MKVLIVIPARLESSRFPRKALHKIKGREMILRVCDRLPNYDKIVATPNGEIAELVIGNGYKAFVTQEYAESGTNRLVEVAKYIKADIYLNVQGDEPLISEETVQKIIDAKVANYDKVVTGIAPLDTSEDCVKVITTGDKWAIGRKLYQHIGIFAFNEAELKRFGEGEMYEGIDLTRFLSSDYPVHFVQVEMTPGVNRPEDIKEVERILCQKK